MPQLERILRDLEIATAALAGEGVEVSQAKLKKRSEAIARLSGIIETVLALGPVEFLEVINRLTRAADAGQSVERDLARLKQTVMAEWSRWNLVHHSLAASGRLPSKKIDC